MTQGQVIYMGKESKLGIWKNGGGVLKTALSKELPFRTADNHHPSTFFTPCLHLENPDPRLAVENLVSMYL